MKGFSVSIIFIAVAVVLAIYLGYSMGTSGFSVKMPTFKATGQVAAPTPTTTTQTPTTTTTTTQTPTTTTTVQVAKLECTTFTDCNDGKSCTIDDCVDNKCTHTLVGADCAVAATTTTTTTTTTTSVAQTTTTTTTQAPSVPPASHIVISEFATKYGTTLSDEFVELYNPTNTEVNIGGWGIQYKSATGTGSWQTYANFVVTKIPPHKFYLAALSSVYSGTTTADYTSISSNGLSDTGGHIRLIDDIGNEIDKVGWGTAAIPESAAAPAQDSPEGSIERKVYWQDTDNNANDFTTRDSRNPQNSKSAEVVPS